METEARFDRVQNGEVCGHALMEELRRSVSQSYLWMDRCYRSEMLYDAIWAGQTQDGLKHGTEDSMAFPWEGASDQRQRLVKTKVAEVSRIMQAAIQRGRWSFRGMEGLDFMKAQQKTDLLKWQLSTQIPGCRRQRNLWLNYAITYGYSVMGLGWRDRTEVVLHDFTVEDGMKYLMSRYGEQEGPVFVENFTWALNNVGDGDDWLLEFLKTVFPRSSAKQRKQSLKELRQTGASRLPLEKVVASYPELRALVPFQDVFHDPDLETWRDARWGAVRRFMSEPELKAYGDWDQDAMKLLIETGGGKTLSEGLNFGLSGTYPERRFYQTLRSSAFAQHYDRSHLYEVFYFYHRSASEDGTTACYCTIMSPHCVDPETGKPLILKQDIYEGESRYLPFEEFTLWDDRASLLDQEGLAYWLDTNQLLQKTIRDHVVDAASIAILPPLRRSERDRDDTVLLAPGQPIYERVAGSTEWFSPPPSRYDLAERIDRMVERESNRLIGMPDVDIPPVVYDAAMIYYVEQVQEAWGRVLARIFMLDQQYLPPTTVMRVSGITGQPFEISKDDIRGSFDLFITFDPKELDPEYSMKKFEMAVRVVQELDRNGIVDTNGLVQIGLSMVDANWAAQLVKDGNSSEQKELAEAMQDIAAIMTGQAPQAKEGVNAALRMQYLQQATSQSPIIQQAIQENEAIRGMFEAYQKNLQFHYDQQVVNPQTGRQGPEMTWK